MPKIHSIAIASDHAGYNLKEILCGHLMENDYQVENLGTDSANSTDYPDYAHAVSQKVASGEASVGVLVCHSGIGMSIVANRHPEIRAAVVNVPEDATLTRVHNDANILCIGAQRTDEGTAKEILSAFLGADFEDGGRHERRVNKINY